jgi:dGTP triphosphohydrolase
VDGKLPLDSSKKGVYSSHALKKLLFARTARKTRIVTDYIAGITDRFAMDEHRRLFDLQEEP